MNICLTWHYNMCVRGLKYYRHYMLTSAGWLSVALIPLRWMSVAGDVGAWQPCTPVFCVGTSKRSHPYVTQ